MLKTCWCIARILNPSHNQPLAHVYARDLGAAVLGVYFLLGDSLAEQDGIKGFCRTRALMYLICLPTVKRLIIEFLTLVDSTVLALAFEKVKEHNRLSFKIKCEDGEELS